MARTAERRWRKIWRDRCRAAGFIRLQYGVVSAFGHVVDEKPRAAPALGTS